MLNHSNTSLFGDSRLPSRFWAKVRVLDNGCWEWQASTANKMGYGEFWSGERLMLAHRFAFESIRGKVPEGRQLDHLCRHPNCVNLDHLEVVTPRENTLRGIGLSAVNARKTHCNRGHPLTDAYIRPNGWRECRECRRIHYYRFYWGYK